MERGSWELATSAQCFETLLSTEKESIPECLNFTVNTPALRMQWTLIGSRCSFNSTRMVLNFSFYESTIAACLRNIWAYDWLNLKLILNIYSPNQSRKRNIRRTFFTDKFIFSYCEKNLFVVYWKQSRISKVWYSVSGRIVEPVFGCRWPRTVTTSATISGPWLFAVW